MVPIVLAAFSPLLGYRDGPYIIAGIAGAVCLSALLWQPLLALGSLPGLRSGVGRRLHRILGPLIALAVLAHVGGLYITSPPDTVDALLLVSPTPFSIWGVTAMVALLVAVLLAGFRTRLGLRRWRAVHYVVTSTIILGGVIHALLINGTMEFWSKLTLCAAILLTTGYGIIYQRVIRPRVSNNRR